MQASAAANLLRGATDVCSSPLAPASCYDDRQMHPGNVMIAHTTGHFIMPGIRGLEGIVDGLCGTWRDGIETNEHVIVLVIFIHRLAIGIGRHEREGVCLFALIAHNKIIMDVGVKLC